VVSNLTPATNYHFQLVAGNSAGVVAGSDLTFTTRHLRSVATTLPATSITPTNATLHGSVNPNGAIAAAYYQYGLTTNYGYRGGFAPLPATNNTFNLPGLMVNALQGPAGASWIQTGASNTNWSSIASSADGSRLAASAYADGVYISTNFGSTWTKTSVQGATGQGLPTPAIASSTDGLRLATV